MSLRQAAQQALEFLSHDMVAEDWPHQKRKDAICDALRAALAEPEQEPVRLQCTTCGTVYADGVPPQVPEQKPQTTHWEGCEAVHPECRKTEHEVKDLSIYEFKTYKTGGAELEAGFYSTDELRDLVKALDKMNAATERSMRRMK